MPHTDPFQDAPAYTYDLERALYLDERGRTVPLARVRAWLDAFLDDLAPEARRITEMLQDGSVTLAVWRREMAHLIKQAHLTGGALAHGGWDYLSTTDRNALTEIIAGEYAYLDRWAAAIEAGEEGATNGAGARATLYVEGARHTYHVIETRALRMRGYDEERSILDPSANTCDECRAEAQKGWRPIGTLKPIGTRTCLARCRCTKHYRKRTTREMRE